MVPYLRTWFDGWVDSASGTGGFWSDQVPREHFRTASSTGDALARMVAGLLHRQPEIEAVIDVGAGCGELLSSLRDLRLGLALTGIDLRPRPAELTAEIGWTTDRWDVRQHTWASGAAADRLAAIRVPTLIVAGEWLDDLPCRVAAYDCGGWREQASDPHGREQPAAPLTGAELRWAQRWWPAGPRAEIGLTRDRAWAHLVAAARPRGGSALLIDYGHLRGGRPRSGSLTGYRRGRQVRPAPTAQTNLTAHVAIDAVRAAGEAVGARTRLCRPQAELVDELWPAAEHCDPVADLVERSRRAAMASPGVWGSQWWLWQA